ncbi:INO80 complex, subunit Ies4 [Kalaharituber pfeilii]|nr:INO80 complex, subunit Ies4 [Kalaharituber pfeilii]
MPPAKKIDPKMAAAQKVVVLKLNPSKLATFKDTAVVSSHSNSNSGSTANSPLNSSPLAAPATPPVGSPGGSEATSSVQTAGAVGAKPGPKRGRQPGVPAAKPGRKKQKLDNGASPALSVPGISGPHKLGPKANQGAINAQLRALDRTGKPCKKWSKTGFTLKSFTGFAWTVPTWGTPAVEKKLEAPQSASKAGNGSTPITPATPIPNPLNSLGGTILDISTNAS